MVNQITISLPLHESHERVMLDYFIKRFSLKLNRQ